ncbi:hypothetical protein [Mucilaginibacter flavidus]|uniref:hypothetical protein n=1 Tax=Mucilaginibacter flavidus TaxID=2949309 RepID=UPI0020938FDD|nr:hypothetical protein [Mucilaginibacter flavidus]MCO5946370.1 hypothetical protein [Mucilaginibacter flavidus]
MKPLFGVFSECLKLDLISKQEVIGHADWIVSTEGDSDRFFIDISLCRDLNDLLVVLNSVNLTDDILQIRVIFGLINLQFLIHKINTDKALSVLSKFTYRKEFTPYETNEMGYLIEEWRRLGRHSDKRAQKKFNERVKVFFDNYSGLYLYDYKNWNEINSKIIKDFLSKKQIRSGFFGKLSKRLKKFL